MNLYRRIIIKLTSQLVKLGFLRHNFKVGDTVKMRIYSLNDPTFVDKIGIVHEIGIDYDSFSYIFPLMINTCLWVYIFEAGHLFLVDAESKSVKHYTPSKLEVLMYNIKQGAKVK